MTKPALLTMRGYAKHRKALGLPGGSQGAVSFALRDRRIAHVPGTTLFDPVASDEQWRQLTEPRVQFPAPPPPGTRQAESDASPARKRFEARALEFVDPAYVLKALHDAYQIIAAEYQVLCGGLASRTAMTVGDLNQMIDESEERLGNTLVPCVQLAFSGETEGC
jgi:hypothetical protein